MLLGRTRRRPSPARHSLLRGITGRMIVETVRSPFRASLPRLLGVAVCSVFALGTGNNVMVMFAIALASASLLTTVGMIVPMDSFAPVTGSALGTTRMSGHEEDGAAPTRPRILLVSPAIAPGGEPLDQRGGLGADWRPFYPVRAGQPIMETGGAIGLVNRLLRSLWIRG